MRLSIRPRDPGMRRQKERYTYHRTQQKLPAVWDTELWPREGLCAYHKALGHLEGDTIQGIHSIRGRWWRWLSRAGAGLLLAGRERIPEDQAQVSNGSLLSYVVTSPSPTEPGRERPVLPKGGNE